MLENIYQKYDVVISDTSSLSNLNNIHKLHLLKDLYNTITITPKILEEYSVRFKEKLPDWITVKDVKNKAKYNELCEIYNEGEASAIAYALENPNTLIIIDDKNPKEYAIEIGLHAIGTLGVIRQAVDQKLVTKKEANDLFDDLKRTGARISDKILESVKYPIENLEVMKCYDYKEEKNKIIEFKGINLQLKSLEILSEMGNILKYNCKDNKGKDIYILQKINESKIQNWYFDKNFNKESAEIFIYSFEK